MQPRNVLSAIALLGGLLLLELALWPRDTDWVHVLGRFSPEEVARASSYCTARYFWFAVSAACQLFLLFILACEPSCRALEMLAAKPGRGPAATAAVVALLCCVAVRGLSLAFGFVSRYLGDVEYGLTRQTAAGWLRDAVLQQALTAAILIATAAAAVHLAGRFGRHWWVPAAALLGSGLIGLAILQPIAIDPLFDSYAPLASRPEAGPLLALAGRAGFDGNRLWVSDASRRTKTMNAFINGLGPTERIALWDTLLTSSRPDEAKLVLAHELGHWAGRHVLLGLTLTVIGLAAALSLLALALPAPTPRQVPALLLALLAIQLASMPLENYVSRKIEAEADFLSLRWTGEFDAYIRAEERLARQNLSNLEPPPLAVWWLYTHPPVGERIQMALDMAAAESSVPSR